MGKVIQYAADAALIAGAIAMTVVTGGGGLFAMGGLITMTAGQVSSTAMAMGMMGGGMLFSSIARAMEGGGASTAMSVKNSAGNRQTIYGQTRANGTVIFLSNGNGVINGNVIYQVIAWASHPCQEVSFLYTDGREIYFYGQGHNAVAGAQGYDDGANHIDPAGNTYNFGGGSGNYHLACWSTLGPYAGFWISQLGEGCPPPGGDYNFTGESKWTASATLNGICATAVAASSNPNMFSQIPQIKAAVKGKNDIYDPRLDPQFAGGATPTLSSSYTPNSAYCAWTDNAALIIADFLVNKDYGLRYTWDEIDIQQLIAAANICDQPVTLATGKLGSWAAGSYFTIGQTIVDSNGRQQTVIGYFNTGVDAQAKTGGSTPNWKTVQGEITYDNQIMWTAGVLGSALTEKQYTINGIIDWAAAPGDSLSSSWKPVPGVSVSGTDRSRYSPAPGTAAPASPMASATLSARSTSSRRSSATTATRCGPSTSAPATRTTWWATTRTTAIPTSSMANISPPMLPNTRRMLSMATPRMPTWRPTAASRCTRTAATSSCRAAPKRSA